MNWRLWVRVATAFAFAAAMAYGLWRLEYTDVFRWGMPGPRLLVAYACYIGVAGSVGWALAWWFTPRFSD
jgi:hypothetical protein